MARLLKEKNGDLYYKELNLEKDPEKLKTLLNDTRWDILKILAEKPSYPAEISKKLDIHEQKVYYHIKQLKKSGIIKLERKEERGGSLAKYYSVKDYAFALELPFGDEKLLDFPVEKKSERLREFLKPFIRNGKVNCNIVVGSPDPHGPHQVRGRDGHFAVDLALLLGQYGSLPSGFATKQDVEVKAESSFKENLILVGGPLTNTITAKINNYLPVRFESEQFPYRKLISDKTGKKYKEENTGIISKIPNPEDPEKSILVVAGVRLSGTRASVLALTEFKEELLEEYNKEDSWARVFQGKDMDGDGKVDSLEFLE